MKFIIVFVITLTVFSTALAGEKADSIKTPFELISEKSLIRAVSIDPDHQEILSANGWYIIRHLELDEKNQGTCTSRIYTGTDKEIWSGETGCTIYPGPEEGFFFAYNPEGGNAEIFNIRQSDDPIAAPNHLPTEHAYSANGEYLLLGGGTFGLYDNTGMEMFSYQQGYNDRDMALGFSPDASYVVIADVVNHGQKDPNLKPDYGFRISGRGRNEHYATIFKTDGTAVTLIRIPEYARAIGVSNNGELIAVASDYSLTVFNNKREQVWKSLFDNPYHVVKSMTVTNDGRVAAAVNTNRMEHNMRFIFVWDKTGDLIGKIRIKDYRALDFYDSYIILEGNKLTFWDDRAYMEYLITPED